MPDLKRLGPLIDRLIERSESGEVPWTETSDEETFQAGVGAFTVTIARDSARDSYGAEVYNYLLKVHDKLGKVLDTVGDTNPAGYWETPAGLRGSTALENLYNVARRRALKVDEQLDDLLGSL